MENPVNVIPFEKYSPRKEQKIEPEKSDLWHYLSQPYR